MVLYVQYELCTSLLIYFWGIFYNGVSRNLLLEKGQIRN